MKSQIVPVLLACFFSLTSAGTLLILPLVPVSQFQWNVFQSKVMHIERTCIERDCRNPLPDPALCKFVNMHNTTADGLRSLLFEISRSFSWCQSSYDEICGECFNDITINENVKGTCKKRYCFDGKVRVGYANDMHFRPSTLSVHPVVNCSDLVMRFEMLFPKIVFDGKLIINLEDDRQRYRIKRHVQISLNNLAIKLDLTLTPLNFQYVVSAYSLQHGPNFTVKVAVSEQNDELKRTLQEVLQPAVNTQFQLTEKSNIATSLMLFINRVVGAYFKICSMKNMGR